MVEGFAAVVTGIALGLVAVITVLACTSGERQEDRDQQFCLNHGGTFYPDGVITKHVIYYDNVCLVP